MATHIAACTYCRQELAQLQGDLAAYSHTVDMHSPPMRVRERLLNQVGREKKHNPVDRLPTPEHVEIPALRSESVSRAERIERIDRSERIENPGQLKASVAAPTFGYGPRSQKSSTRIANERHIDPEAERGKTTSTTIGKVFARVFAWMGWATAATLAIVAGNLYHQGEAQRAKIAVQAGTIDRLNSDTAGARQLIETITDTSARQVTLTKDQGEPIPAMPHGRVTYIAAKGALIFLASNLDPVETYKTYELWLIPADGRDPIPAGTFHPDPKGNASVILPPLPKGIDARTFGITVEDEGGSQTPTMPIVLAGN